MSGGCQTCKQVADGAQNESVSFGAKFRYSARHNEQHNERKKQRRRTKHGNDDCQGVQHDSHRIFGRPRFYIGRFGSRVNQLLCFNRFKRVRFLPSNALFAVFCQGKYTNAKMPVPKCRVQKNFLMCRYLLRFRLGSICFEYRQDTLQTQLTPHIYLTVGTASEFLKNLNKARQNLPCLVVGGSGIRKEQRSCDGIGIVQQSRHIISSSLRCSVKKGTAVAVPFVGFSG